MRTTKTVNNITRARPERRPFLSWTEGSRMEMMPRPVQRQTEWMMNLLFEFCMALKLTLDTCTRIFRISKECSQLPTAARVFVVIRTPFDIVICCRCFRRDIQRLFWVWSRRRLGGRKRCRKVRFFEWFVSPSVNSWRWCLYCSAQTYSWAELS